MGRLLFLREAIILNISVWRVGGGGNYFREMMSRGTAIFRGNMVLLLALT